MTYKMNMNNKKGQFVTLGLIIAIAILVGGFIFIEGKLEERNMIINYVGDSVSHIVYNIKSNNIDCDVNNIMINRNNIEYFNHIDEVPEEYTFDENCY